MKKTVLLAPINMGTGLYTVTHGFVRALEKHGLKTLLLQPFSHENKGPSLEITNYTAPLSSDLIQHLLSNGEEEQILEFILRFTDHYNKECDVLVIEGLALTSAQNYATKLNHSIALCLSADIVLVASPMGKSIPSVIETIEIEAANFGGNKNPKLLGCIINKIGAPTDRQGNTRIDLFDPPEEIAISKEVIEKSKIPILATIPWKRSLMGTSVSGIKTHLSAELLNPEEFKDGPILHFALAAANISNVTSLLKSRALILTSGDREDILIAACLAFLSGIDLAGIVLTGGHLPSKETVRICQQAIASGFPILLVKTDSLRTAINLQNLNTLSIKEDPIHRDRVNNYIASKIDPQFFISFRNNYDGYTLSPAAFRYRLMTKAQKGKKRILLPESEDIRILQAAEFCMKKGIAHILLLGDKKRVETIAENNGIKLSPEIEIIDPKTMAPNYVQPLLEIRKHKGLTEKNAIDYLTDPIVVGMMMLFNGEVDGLVAGATTTTAHVLSPALKILGTKEGINLVSSVFFMCMPSEILVYGDCAVNQNPTAQGLADIAIQSAATAKAFDIDPIVAMISYSTLTSGFGKEVEKVKEATEIVRSRSKELICDGPLQYDAAKVPEIAKKKAPDSPVAGKASVFIFPDLNTANTTYKAVQRSAGVLSIGPILQGLKKPVNDLSRGATVEDIIYTIAITAIQAL